MTVDTEKGICMECMKICIFFNGTNNNFFRQSIDLWGLFPFTYKELCIQHTQSTRLRPILMRVVRLIPPVHLADASFFLVEREGMGCI